MTDNEVYVLFTTRGLREGTQSLVEAKLLHFIGDIWGAFGTATAAFDVLVYDEKKELGILATTHTHFDNLRAALALMSTSTGGFRMKVEADAASLLPIATSLLMKRFIIVTVLGAANVSATTPDIDKDLSTGDPIFNSEHWTEKIKRKDQHHDVVKQLHHDHVAYERGPLTCNCPDNFRLNGDRCEREIVTPQQSKCATGFVSEGTICVKRQAPMEECPFGYAQVKNQCIRRDIRIPQLACPDRYVLETTGTWGKHEDQLTCTAKIHVPPVQQCPDGKPFSGACYTPETISASFSCPQGYSDAPNHTCNRFEEVECANALKQKHLRRLSERESEHHDIHSTWDSDVSKAAVFGSPPPTKEKWNHWHGDKLRYDVLPSVVQIDQKCTANVTIPATPFCAFGTLKGRNCIIQELVKPRLHCPAYGTPENCFAFDRKSPKSVCPEGFVQECTGQKHGSITNCDCVRHVEMPVQLVCPLGAVLNDGMCLMKQLPTKGCHSDSKAVDGMCVKPEYASSICTYSVNFACQGPYCHIGNADLDSTKHHHHH